MNVLLPCHNPTLHAPIFVVINGNNDERIKLHKNYYSQLSMSGFDVGKVTYIDPSITEDIVQENIAKFNAFKSWDNIPNDSQDIVHPIMCPIMTTRCTSILQELIRVVKPNTGYIYIAIVNPFDQPRFMDDMIDNFINCDSGEELQFEKMNISAAPLLITTTHGIKHSNFMLTVRKIRPVADGVKRIKSRKSRRRKTRRQITRKA
jgi:hypothetical protein